jgi:Smg protein
MFDILVYLYETYCRPESCPDSIVLAKKLSAVGFDEDEIVDALDWLNALVDTTKYLERDLLLEETNSGIQRNAGFRIYTEQEVSTLGIAAIGFVHYLENANLLNAQQRELVVDRAMALEDSPVDLDELKIVVLMILWSQGQESGMLRFDDLLLPSDESTSRLLH